MGSVAGAALPAPATGSRQRSERRGSPIQWALCLVLLGVVGIPLATVLWGAFRSDAPLSPTATYSLEAIGQTYGELVRGGPFAHVFLDSVVLALLVMALCVVIGASLSFLIARTDMPGRSVMRVLLLTPLFYSPLLDIIGWEFLFADRSGMLNQWWVAWTGATRPLFSIYTYAGVVLVMTLHLLPYVVLLLAGPMQTLDSATEEAAEVFGATRWQTVRLVTWRILRPAVAAAALFVFILAIETFTIPYILGNRIRLETLAMWVYEWVQGFTPNLPAAAAGGSVLMLTAAIVLYFYRRLTAASGNRFVTIGGRGFRSRTLGLGRWRWPVGLVALLVISTFTIVPFLAVLLRSLLRVRSTTVDFASLSFDQYRRLFQSAPLADIITNSLSLAIGGAILCVLVGGTIGLWKARRQSVPVSLADYLLMASFGLPGVLVGLGLLWTFVTTPLYLTFWILLLAVVVRFSGLAVQGTNAAALQMDRNLEEAAESFGASRFFATWRVIVPILKGTLLSLWLTLFLILVRELSMTVLLYSPTTKTMTIQAWNYTTDGDFGLAASLSMAQFAITLVVVLVWRFAGRGSLGTLGTGLR